MKITNKNETFLLFLGDVFFFVLALWLTLFIRFQVIPEPVIFFDHLEAFVFIFALWVSVFFISGLYEKHTLILKSRIPTIIFNAQIINSGIAVLFFYFVPIFGIAPKTNLFVYVVLSFFLILFWRNTGVEFLSSKERESAILIGSGEEVEELKEEVNNNSLYGINFVTSVDVKKTDPKESQEKIVQAVRDNNITVVAADLRDLNVQPLLPNLYRMIFSRVRFIDMYKIYEDIFDRVPMSLIRDDWFLSNVAGTVSRSYDIFKRALDLVGALLVGLVSLLFYPLIIIAIKLEDGGPIFFAQDRVGQNNKIFTTYKFRSMTVHNEKDGIAKDAEVTRIGNFLRKTRLDELPQIWNVIRGDLSLVGPRPEIPALVEVYEKEIPYYNVRHLIKPGLSGWAQLYQRTPPKWAAAVHETKLKLSYDLYYLKNRSFMLDVKIGLKTIKTLVSIAGI
ncbi:MAG TPA: exopolysaccharide biosynthesis polyprenyl glycosylphosphotransferase [Candidatus Nanoarchaeia archaeon]|nr:exopolysaccharide biosynthesis polyprenyl glycosylphosphotransferase [Candidatus Nanoarchaeia archaeon]